MVRVSINHAFRFLGLLLVLVFLIGAGSCPRNQSSIPTYVLAWTGQDPSHSINTLESHDAVTWFQKRTHVGSSSNVGPAIAHDGHLGWMLMWATPTGGSLKFLTGIGSGSTSGSEGISWGTDIETISISPERYAVAETPNLACGNGRWMVTFTTDYNNSQGIQVIREVPQPGSTVWESAMRVDGASHTAIAFGQNKFLLTYYVINSRSSVAITSTDGITWSSPNNISIDPEKLSYYNGLFYAIVLERNSAGGDDHLNWERFKIYKSADGTNWNLLADRATVAQNSIVGGCYGPCKMVVFDYTNIHNSFFAFLIGTPPENECINPSSLSFGAATILNETSSRSLSVAFGDVRP